MKKKFNKSGSLFFFCIIIITHVSELPAQTTKVSVDWDKIIMISKTTPTLQVVENPKLRLPSAFHDSAFNALKNLGADYVRYVPWFPYPKLAVAELKAPTRSETFWDFTFMDSTIVNFMKATKGHPVVINFSTTPAWMWKTDSEVKYPYNPYELDWSYNQGTQMRDTTYNELAGYYERVYRWYTQGGFTDELGEYHSSGHHYKITYWEVLNEPDLEHNITPETYTKMYDAIVARLSKISPDLKFIGISVAFNNDPHWFEYFLNPLNHKKGIPLDGISYHHYSTPSSPDQNIDSYQYTFFEKADAFLFKVRYIESIRKRLSPNTITTINEIGSIIGANEGKKIPDNYWNLSGALYAYMFLELTKLGIEVAGESQLVGYPTQFPDVSMMNWENGNPNARYWVLKLLKENFGPGDQLAETSFKSTDVMCQAFHTSHGKNLLLINKRNREIRLEIPDEFKNSICRYVDESTGESLPGQLKLKSNKLVLQPFAVAVLLMN